MEVCMQQYKVRVDHGKGILGFLTANSKANNGEKNACLNVGKCTTCRPTGGPWTWVRNHVVLRINPQSSAKAKGALNC